MRHLVTVMTATVSGSESISAVVCRPASIPRNPPCHFQPLTYRNVKNSDKPLLTPLILLSTGCLSHKNKTQLIRTLHFNS